MELGIMAVLIHHALSAASQVYQEATASNFEAELATTWPTHANVVGLEVTAESEPSLRQSRTRAIRIGHQISTKGNVNIGSLLRSGLEHGKAAFRSLSNV